MVGEGIGGLGRRILAWAESRGMKPDDPALGNVRFVPEAVQLKTAAVNRFLKGAVGAFSGPLALIVVDTLARSTVGIEENGAKDMGLVIHEADRIRRETKVALSGSPRWRIRSWPKWRGRWCLPSS